MEIRDKYRVYKWVFRSKEGNSILMLPDEKGGGVEFDSEIACVNAFRDYKHKEKYCPLEVSSKKPKEEIGSKIDNFMKD